MSIAMDGKNTDGRSAALGGIDGLARRYEDERVSLSEIANIVGCSRQMVWDDLVRHLGRLPHPPARYARARGFDGPRLFLAHFADDGREVPAAAVDLVERAYQDFEADSIERLSDGFSRSCKKERLGLNCASILDVPEKGSQG